MFPVNETRFRALVVLVAVGTIVVGLAVWRSWPDPAEKEFPLAAQALTAIKSFRYEHADLAGPRPNPETHEILCPSRQRLTIASASGDQGMWEYSFVDGTSFHRTPQTGGWQDYRDEFGLNLGLDPGILCRQLAAGQYTPPFPPYAMLLRRGFPERGALKTLEGGRQCREWKVQVPQMGIADSSESFCLDSETHLPLLRLTTTSRYVFSDFNAAFAIEVPRIP